MESQGPSEALKNFWLEDLQAFQGLNKDAQAKMIAWTKERESNAQKTL